MTKTVVAVDVSKHKLDVYDDSNGLFITINNDKKDINKLVRDLLKKENILVALEPTGGYELLALNIFVKNGIECTMCPGKRVRDFAKSQGKAKTDKLDAKMIAEYAKVSNPLPYSKIDTDLKDLKELKTRRRQILDLINQEENRLEQERIKLVSQTIKATIKYLKKQLALIENEIDNLSQKSDLIKENVKLLTSIPGIGRICAVTLIAELPELGKLSKSKISSLAGLAPRNCDSGTFRGHRFVNRSRSEIKKVLYMAAMAAIKCNQRISKFYESLKARGKPGKLALVACMRKLVVYMNFMIKNKQSWNENIQIFV